VSGDHSSSVISARVRHVEALLEQRGLLEDGEIDRRIDEFAAGGTPANGARVVARAWTDPGFAERLLADANAALPELGLSMSGGLQEQRLKVVANSADEHNVVVRGRAAGGHPDFGVGRQRRVAVHGAAPPSRGHRVAVGAGAGRAGHPQGADRHRAGLKAGLV
jgi:nitrile hydratase alpha subunit